MDRQNNQYQINDEYQIDREKLSDLIRRIRESTFTYHDPYQSSGTWEYIRQPGSQISYSRRRDYEVNWGFTPQPEDDDEGMSNDDLEESQKMLFDFLGVSE